VILLITFDTKNWQPTVCVLSDVNCRCQRQNPLSNCQMSLSRHDKTPCQISAVNGFAASDLPFFVVFNLCFVRIKPSSGYIKQIIGVVEINYWELMDWACDLIKNVSCLPVHSLKAEQEALATVCLPDPRTLRICFLGSHRGSGVGIA